MLGIRLKSELEEKLKSLANGTGGGKSYHAREAVEDYLKGIAALQRRGPTVALEEVGRRLGYRKRLYR